MNSLQKALIIYRNQKLFEEIREGKNAFLGMLENISNRIALEDLKKVHPNHKGIKISKGNELEHCPYQVLDLIRNFDPESGINIRLLHWWGKGMFLFILVGKTFFKKKDLQIILKDNQLPGFTISTSLSPFAYKEIVGDYEQNKSKLIDLSSNFSDLGRLQLMKQVPYSLDFFETEELILSELTRILSVMQNIERY